MNSGEYKKKKDELFVEKNGCKIVDYNLYKSEESKSIGLFVFSIIVYFLVGFLVGCLYALN